MTTYPAIEPVAYRWRARDSKHWIYDPTPEWIEDHRHEVDIEPLYGPEVVGNMRSQLVTAKNALFEIQEMGARATPNTLACQLGNIAHAARLLLTDDLHQSAPPLDGSLPSGGSGLSVTTATGGADTAKTIG